MISPSLNAKPGFYNQLGYHSATVATREGRSPTHASGEAHSEYDRIKLIGQSREFIRDNCIYRGMIERMTSYIVGNGFDLQVRSESKTYNETAEGLWHDYWKRPEIKGIVSGRRLERMICREILTAGDTAVIKTNKDGLLQHIEAEQIVSSKLKDGIEKDAYGRPVKFWVSGYNKHGRLSTSEAKEYNANDILFITDPERPSSVRGVPPCQASFPMLHRINDVCDSEAIAWQLLARIALSVTKDRAGEIAFDTSNDDTEKEGTEWAQRVHEVDYALIFHGEKGEEIKGVEHNLPGSNFSESLIMFLRLLGLPLGLPLEIILLDWTKSNYSQSRAVLEQAYQIFLGWQFLIEEFFLRPVYEWKIAQWTNAGSLGRRKDGLWHEWTKPTFPWIDQLKEAQAYAAKLDRGFSTHAMVCKALDLDRENVIIARKQEVLDAIEIADDIKKQTGRDVPWQIFAGLEAEPSAKGQIIPQDDNGNNDGTTANN